MNNNEQKSARLERFRSLYSEARAAAEGRISEMHSYMDQYLGSAVIDGSSEAASYVRNITFEIIESEIDPNVPYPKADTTLTESKRISNAAMIERLCRSVRERLPFEELNDRDERYTYVYGASVWYVEWDESLRFSNELGGVRVHCLPPTDFIGQPGISEVEDMEYCFLKFTTTRDELTRRYGVKEADLSLADVEYEYGENASGSDTVSVITAYYRDTDAEIGCFIFSGSLVLADQPRFYKRKVAHCKECGAYFGQCDCKDPEKQYKELTHERVNASLEPETFGEILIPYYTPRSYPIVIRRNTRTEKSLFGISDCRIMRPQQQAINKIESRILKKLIRAGIFPILPEDASLSASNSVFGEIIRMRQGESAENYGKLDTTPDIRNDILEADRLYDQAKRVIGISDALQGTDTSLNESGYARELKINRATSRLETKKRIKYHTYSRLYELIFRHYLAFFDRTEATFSESGEIRASFDRYAFIEPDTDGGLSFADDYLFSVDLDNGSEYGRSLLWQKNLENLESGTLGDKDDPRTLLRYWKSQVKAHYPFARENVEHLEEILKERND